MLIGTAEATLSPTHEAASWSGIAGWLSGVRLLVCVSGRLHGHMGLLGELTKGSSLRTHQPQTFWLNSGYARP